MKKILLATAPYARDPAWYLPLGLLTVASALKREGIHVDILDIDGERMKKEQVRSFFSGNQYEIVGISALTSLYNYIEWLAQTIKEASPGTKVILGGNLASSHPEFILKNTSVDICVFGEGEYTMPELVNCINKKNDFSQVKGIWYKENNSIRTSGPRPLVNNLDVFYPLDYGLVSLKKYIFPGSLIASRGCTHRCTYCFQPYKGVRKRSPKGLFDEILLLKNKYKVNFFSFLDAYFLSDKKFLQEICDLIKRADIRWECNERLDQVEEEGLRKMKSAGCISISYGIESFNQDILNEMNKGMTLEKIERGLEITRKAGIKQVCASFIFGFFQESQETINRNIDFAKKHKMSSFCFYLTPFPGTKLYSEATKRGFITDEKKYFKEHIGRGDEFSTISNRFYLNMTSLSDEQLINGYARFCKELRVKGSLFFRLKEFIKLRAPDLCNFIKRCLRK